jgi:hypothetical protein
VLGPDGAAQPALTLATSGGFGEQLALTFPMTLVGQVMLSARSPLGERGDGDRNRAGGP